MLEQWPGRHPGRIDRSAHLRSEVDPASARAIVVRDGAVMTVDGALVECEPGQHPAHDLWCYLGRDGDRDYIAVVPQVAVSDDGIGGERMTTLRDFVALAADRPDGDRNVELAATAIALSLWHASHDHCAVCGRPTAAALSGWLRRCEACDRDHYPRTDPAVIVAITDRDDRLLLAHAAYWSPLRYSHLAGYVEPGESLEQAVHREVREECGLEVTDLRYVGSQPWPFPASIMVAFTATAVDTDITIDDDEITDARFMTRDDVTAAVEAGDMVLAPRGSIARAMIDDWTGGDAVDSGRPHQA